MLINELLPFAFCKTSTHQHWIPMPRSIS